MSPYQLTHIVYVVLVVVFVSVQSYMVFYNLRMKKREREIALNGRAPDSKEQLLLEAQDSFRRHGR